MVWQAVRSRMSAFSSYIDRQKSGIGSSEKSQKVHSANWKEEIQLRKELDCLRRQEQQRVCRLSYDQRLVVDRFYRKLSRSVYIAEKHEKVKGTLPQDQGSRKQSHNSIANVENHMRQIRCLNAFPKPPVPKFRRPARRSKSCEPVAKTKEDEDQTFKEFMDLPPRPMTSLEKRNKMWEKQLNSMTQRINRARSAPARPAFYQVPEFSKSKTTKPDHFGRKSARQRAKTVECSTETFRLNREKEVEHQNRVIREFLKTITPLELVPWTPFEAEANSKEFEAFNSDNFVQNQIESAARPLKKHAEGLALYDLDHRVVGTFERTERNPLKAWT